LLKRAVAMRREGGTENKNPSTRGFRIWQR
jgi:hypothetical protein